MKGPCSHLAAPLLHLYLRLNDHGTPAAPEQTSEEVCTFWRFCDYTHVTRMCVHDLLPLLEFLTLQCVSIPAVPQLNLRHAG